MGRLVIILEHESNSPNMCVHSRMFFTRTHTHLHARAFANTHAHVYKDMISWDFFKCDYKINCFFLHFTWIISNLSLSFAFVCRWLKDLLKLGLEKPIDTQDVYKNLKQHDAAQITDRFNELWQNEISNQKRPRIFNVIRKMFINRIIGLSILYSIVDIISR